MSDSEFQKRYEQFFLSLEYIHDKYSPFFIRKDDENGFDNTIYEHIEVTNSKKVSIKFFPRNYLPPEIIADLKKLFLRYFYDKE